jgi:hypothetical protein
MRRVLDKQGSHDSALTLVYIIELGPLHCILPHGEADALGEDYPSFVRLLNISTAVGPNTGLVIGPLSIRVPRNQQGGATDFLADALQFRPLQFFTVVRDMLWWSEIEYKYLGTLLK